MNGKNIFTGLGGGNDRFAQLIAGRMAATLDGMPATRLIDQNPAHRFRCRAKKMRPARPVLFWMPLHEANVSFVDKRGSLQGLTGRFLSDLQRRKLAQFVVDLGQQLFGGVGIALFDGGQDAGDFAHGGTGTGDSTPPAAV